MKEFISRISIIAVGVSNYLEPLNHLTGPLSDVRKLENLLVKNKNTALFSENQFSKLENPSSNDIKNKINEYVIGRSADQDILIFYFSGHGIALNNNDFGFCATDTIINPKSNTPMPFSLVKYSELITSLYSANIIPMIIIDACYSGAAGRAHYIPPIESIFNLNKIIHSFNASQYCLLCSSSQDEYSHEDRQVLGGLFSNIFSSIGERGISPDKEIGEYLIIQNIFPEIVKIISQVTEEMTPRLFIGETLPKFPLMKNVQFRCSRISLSPTLVMILKHLWNDGNCRTLTPPEIGKLCGNGAYCNHNKLSFKDWDLVETLPHSKSRRLNERGILFMKGQLKVPKVLLFNPSTKEIIPEDKDFLVGINDF